MSFDSGDGNSGFGPLLADGWATTTISNRPQFEQCEKLQVTDQQLGHHPERHPDRGVCGNVPQRMDGLPEIDPAKIHRYPKYFGRVLLMFKPIVYRLIERSLLGNHSSLHNKT